MIASQLTDIICFHQLRCKYRRQPKNVSPLQSLPRSSVRSTRYTSSSPSMQRHIYLRQSASPSTSSRIWSEGRRRVSSLQPHQRFCSYKIGECEALACSHVQDSHYRHHPLLRKQSRVSQAVPSWKARRAQASSSVGHQRDLLACWWRLQRVGLSVSQESQWTDCRETRPHDRPWPWDRSCVRWICQYQQ